MNKKNGPTSEMNGHLNSHEMKCHNYMLCLPLVPFFELNVGKYSKRTNLSHCKWHQATGIFDKFNLHKTWRMKKARVNTL